MIFASLASRKPSIFAEKDWKTLPWAPGVTKKCKVQYIFDIIADATILMPNRDALQDAATRGLDVSTSELYQDTTGLADELLHQVEEWNQDWELLHGHKLQETQPLLPLSSLFPFTSKEELPWSTVYTYLNLDLANDHAMYNATLILLLLCKKSLLLLQPECDIDEIASISLQAELAGVEICRSVDYHLMDFQEGIGGLYLLFPMRVAWQAVGESSSPAGRWLESICEAITKGQKGRWGSAASLMKDVPPRGTQVRCRQSSV